MAVIYYSDQATFDGAWENLLNWWDDASCVIPHGAIPASGDVCHTGSAIGTSGSPLIGSGTVNLGAGSCDIVGTINGAGGTIAGGTWTGATMTNLGNITGGSFSGDNFDNSGTIQSASITGVGAFNAADGTVTADALADTTVFTSAHLVNHGTIHTKATGGDVLLTGIPGTCLGGAQF